MIIEREYNKFGISRENVIFLLTSLILDGEVSGRVELSESLVIRYHLDLEPYNIVWSVMVGVRYPKRVMRFRDEIEDSLNGGFARLFYNSIGEIKRRVLADGNIIHYNKQD